jgi:hypothetical protein
LTASGIVFGWAKLWAKDVKAPFDVEAFSAVSVPKSENAFTYYREAFNRFVARSPASGGSKARRQPASNEAQILGHGWTGANAALRSCVIANRQSLDLWKRGTECRKALEASPELGNLEQRLYEVQSLRDLARVALVEAERVSAERGAAEAWTWYRGVLVSSRHAGMHAPSVGRLVGVALWGTAVDPVLRWSSRAELTANDLRKAVADAEAIEAMTAPLSETLKAEYIFSTGSFSSQLPPNAPGGLDLVVDFNQSLALVYGNWLSQADRPRFRRKPARGSKWFLFETDSGKAAPGSAASAAEIERLCGLATPAIRVDARLIELLMPSIKSLFSAVDREAVSRAALVVGLALQLHYREHGRFPAELSELVQGGYLPRIPADPFGKGEAIRYRREPDARRGALLWSVWYDGVDQDAKVKVELGREDSRGDRVFQIVVPHSSTTVPRSVSVPKSR